MKTRTALTLVAGLLAGSALHAQPEAPEAPGAEPRPEKRTERRTVIVKRHAGEEPRPGAPAEKAAWIGIEPGPVGPTLAAQLGLAEGTGLVVENVLPESPAEAAGIKRHDVLTKLDDQILIEVRQLQVLVRSRKAGDKVKVTYLRAGKEETATVTLAERTLPPMGPRPMWFGQAPAMPEMPEMPGMPDAPRAPRAPRAPGEFRFETSGLPPEVVERVMEALGEAGERAGEAAERGAEAFERAMEGMRKSHGMRTVTVLDLGDSEITVNDGDHTLTVKGKPGSRELTVTDRDGKELFKGPVNSEEDRAKLPPEIREKFERIQSDVRIAPEAPAEGKHIRVIRAGKETVL